MTASLISSSVLSSGTSLLPLLLWYALQDAAKGKEDFSCGQYNGDDQQIEAVLVSSACLHWCEALCDQQRVQHSFLTLCGFCQHHANLNRRNCRQTVWDVELAKNAAPIGTECICRRTPAPAGITSSTSATPTQAGPTACSLGHPEQLRCGCAEDLLSWLELRVHCICRPAYQRAAITCLLV